MTAMIRMLRRSLGVALCALIALIATQPVAQAARTTTYYHTDGLGSVVAASNQAGELLWRKEYAPFGDQIDQTADTEKLSYTGKPHDDLLGLTNLGARYYDPHLGRFMSPDPVGFVESNPMSFNRYSYGNNNPYRFIDPDGREVYDTTTTALRKTFGYGTEGKGHHWVPFGSTNGPDMDLSNQARLVFGQSVSGEMLPDQDHLPGHTRYTEAVRKELYRFAKQNGIKLSDMTAAQAEDFVNHIKSSQIPEIRDLNSRVMRFTEKSLAQKTAIGKFFLRKLALVGVVDYASQTISTETAACRATNCAELE